MRTHLYKFGALCAIVLATGCQTTPSTTSAQDEAPAPKNPEFAGEMARFNAQFPNEKVAKYEEESIRFNNANKLDEKGGCHEKSKYPVTIILLLDASGKVTQSMTDVENSKAQCFRNSYASAQFPRPPIAPYRKAMQLR
ncbi:hypothetical protein [Massilia sp. erpn]|uniref:hypothetical protein n=1 Tax=Massilia sp. erpn TaxID=2738142 RepID=UPI0021058CD2|nr:hypothetical protein [Massilia sp. erpn]UTY58719.1 hypothetical protein HPQ68_16905 [Massilia sp. erpn]